MTRDFDGVGVIEADGADRGLPSSSSSPSSPHSTGSMGGVDQDGELVADRHQTMGLHDQQPESVPSQHRSQSQSLGFGSFSHGVGVGVGVVGSGSSSRSSSARRVDTASGLGHLYSNFAEEDVAIFECQASKGGSLSRECFELAQMLMVRAYFFSPPARMGWHGMAWDGGSSFFIKYGEYVWVNWMLHVTKGWFLADVRAAVN